MHNGVLGFVPHVRFDLRHSIAVDYGQKEKATLTLVANGQDFKSSVARVGGYPIYCAQIQSQQTANQGVRMCAAIPMGSSVVIDAEFVLTSK